MASIFGYVTELVMLAYVVARLPVLTPMDNVLCGHTKSVAYRPKWQISELCSESWNERTAWGERVKLSVRPQTVFTDMQNCANRGVEVILNSTRFTA